MPLLVFVYFTQYLDKNILSYASVMGFPVKGIWYNDVAQAFYMGFLIWCVLHPAYAQSPEGRPCSSNEP